MSDDTYDDLLGYVLGHEEAEAIGPTGDIAHPVRMYSLKKYYEEDQEAPLFHDPVQTVKLDGSAVSLTFRDGHLIRGLTRGDGVYGKEITDKVVSLINPKVQTKKFITVFGEVVAPKDLPNSRNFAAGTLNLKNFHEFLNRVGRLRFFAYDIFFLEEDRIGKYNEILPEYAELLGLDTVFSEKVETYPTDGLVFRENDFQLYNSLGYTASYPRGAYALKKRNNTYITKLIDVEWNTGRTGVVAPTAILEPVETVDGAIISRATLNNINFIKELNLEIGCLVRIERAGEIIPRIIERVD